MICREFDRFDYWDWEATIGWCWIVFSWRASHLRRWICPWIHGRSWSQAGERWPDTGSDPYAGSSISTRASLGYGSPILSCLQGLCAYGNRCQSKYLVMKLPSQRGSTLALVGNIAIQRLDMLFLRHSAPGWSANWTNWADWRRLMVVQRFGSSLGRLQHGG